MFSSVPKQEDLLQSPDILTVFRYITVREISSVTRPSQLTVGGYRNSLFGHVTFFPHTRTYTLIHPHNVNILFHILEYLHTCTYTRTYLHVHTHKPSHIYIHLHTQSHSYLHTHIFIYTPVRSHLHTLHTPVHM